jgi:hypothetical protein
MNTKIIVWGSFLTDEREQVVSNACARFSVLHLNLCAVTHVNLVLGTSSALYLAFCSPRMAVHLEWSVLADLHGSDHYPVNLHIYGTCLVVY